MTLDWFLDNVSFNWKRDDMGNYVCTCTFIGFCREEHDQAEYEDSDMRMMAETQCAETLYRYLQGL